MKMLVITVGYNQWALSDEDAYQMVGIARRSRRVEYAGDLKRRFVESKHDIPFLEGLKLEEIEEEDPELMFGEAEPEQPQVQVVPVPDDKVSF